MLSGNVRQVLNYADRFRGWLRFAPWQAVVVTLLAAGAGLCVHRRCIRPTMIRSLASSGTSTLRRHRSFAATAVLCGIVFAWLDSFGTWRLVYEDSFGDFYDYQAVSLLQGRLDVPERALMGEAFIWKGKIYGYFGLTPAVLRIPLVIFNVGFGTVTRAAQLVAFAGCLLGAYLVLCHVMRVARPANPAPPAWLTAMFTVNAGLGSTLFFLASRAYVYHEAILWGVAFAVCSVWASLRYLEQPASRWWLWAAGFALLSIHARPPTGLFAFTFLGCVTLVLLGRDGYRRAAWLRLFGIGAVCATGVLSFNGASYLKFETIEGCPLRLNVQYSAERLARIDGKQFHTANIPFVWRVYVASPNARFKPTFPWIFPAAGDEVPTVKGAKMDMIDRTIGMPWAMTGLTLLAVVGGCVAFASCHAVRGPLIATWLAVLPMAVAMFAAIATSHRYTADFCPFLITAAAFGVVAVALAQPLWRRVAVPVLMAATFWAVAVQAALGIEFQGAGVWGVPEGTQDKYRELQQRIDRWFKS